MRVKKIGLIIHAGAGTHLKDLKRAKKIQERLTEFCQRGHRYLKNHSALDTVTEVVRWLEDWPETNAGTGSMLQSDGVARLSASLMDGHRQRFSSVVNIEKIKNPILVAKLLQTEKDRVLAGAGAARFAFQMGFKPSNPRTKESVKRWKRLKKEKYGTVGACALDSHEYLAAATSTGGRGMEQVGRVSDSAMPAGNYANKYAACSATGIGEDIIEETLCSRLVFSAKNQGNLEKSFQMIFQDLRARKRHLAAIGISQTGRACWNKTTDILYYSFLTPYKSETFQLV